MPEIFEIKFFLLHYKTTPIIITLALLFIASFAWFEHKKSSDRGVFLLFLIILLQIIKQTLLFVIFTARPAVFLPPVYYCIFDSALSIITIYLAMQIFNQKTEAKIFIIAAPVLFILLLTAFILLIGSRGTGSFELGFRLFDMVMLFWAAGIIGRMTLFTDPDYPFHVMHKVFFIYFLLISAFSVMFFFPESIKETIAIGAWFEYISLYLMSGAGYFLLIFTDKITGINEIELEDRIDNMQHEKDITVNLLHKIGNAIVDATDKSQVLELIVNSAVETTDARAAIIWLYNEEKKLFECASMNGTFPPLTNVKSYILERIERIVNKTRSDTFSAGETYAGKVAAGKTPMIVRDLNVKAHPDIPQSIPGIIDIVSLICVPVMLNEIVIGVMAVVNKQNFSGNFSESDASMMRTLADQCAITINHFRLFKESMDKKMSEKEVLIAGQIQKGLLPSEFINSDKFEIYGFSYPAKGVGGDYFDFVEFDKDVIGVIMSDVAGKGVPASLVMVMIRSIFRTFATGSRSPREVVEKVNNSMTGDVSEDRYATFFYYMINIKKKTLLYTNGAHGPLLLFHKKAQEFELLDTQGMPVGIMKNSEYEEKSAKVDSGDILVLYTDGVTEAMNPKRDQFSIERVKEIILANQDAPLQQMVDQVYEKMTVFKDGAPQHDDETLLISRIK
ncbi:MAG: hypothetical protein A2096_09775 [Spirochaetes bacterium GWF1_41_5]|nr:MAG: hypothetical protein A2096_09775 [Spirochaetes bacterium GWF1_41_5]HBE01269.1 hypothetical protein [Spirochaetia bacterium]